VTQERDRSIGAQIDRMRCRWPEFDAAQRCDGVVWSGPLRPIQRVYSVAVAWRPLWMPCPYVTLVDPPLRPRAGGRFDDIHHLLYAKDDPAQSALCLFDPNGGEWDPSMLIADTTIPWATHWLYFYELWHFDGVWRGGGVGPSTVAEARRAAFRGTQGGDASDPA